MLHSMWGTTKCFTTIFIPIAMDENKTTLTSYIRIRTRALAGKLKWTKATAIRALGDGWAMPTHWYRWFLTRGLDAQNLIVLSFAHSLSTVSGTRNSAIADINRATHLWNMQWRGWPSQKYALICTCVAIPNLIIDVQRLRRSYGDLKEKLGPSRLTFQERSSRLSATEFENIE